jgi:site-specific recombinase XerD
MQEAGETSLAVIEGQPLADLEMPKLIAGAGAAASFAWEEFFLGKIRNAYTRRAYLHAVRRFLRWVEDRRVDLARITPGLVGQYFDDLAVSTPTKKLHLAAIRSFFDVLVQRHIVVLNPSLSVRPPRYSVQEGKTPTITVEQAKRLLASIKLETVVDFRDQAIIATLIYTAARAGAVGKLRLKDLADDGAQRILRFAEKGGKARSIPVRSDLERYIAEYIFAGAMEDDVKDMPLFRTGAGRKAKLTGRAMSNVDICRMVKRRLKEAGLPQAISPHSFRSCAATDLLLHGASLEDVQALLGHSDSRVTKLYDRGARTITRNIVERISV